MTEEEKENWKSCKYRMKEEGFHYCFHSYSNWDEMQDEGFHKLRKDYIESSKLLQKYVDDKVKSFEEEDEDLNYKL